MKERAAAYIRVSTEDQTEYSPEAQKKALKRYADSNNMILLDNYIYADEGISGRKAEKRPAFMKMIADAKKKNRPFDVILVHKFDRFARNREDSVVYKSLLRKQCGVKVISITESIEDDRIGILIEPMLEALAEYYSVNLSEEVKKGMIEKATRGECQTIAAFGYKWVNGSLVIEESEAQYVRYIYDKFLADIPRMQIARNLNELGVRTHKGNIFENRAVNYILHNPLYCGYTRWTPLDKAVGKKIYDSKNAIIAKGKHEPIITEETFKKAQEKLAYFKAITPKKARPEIEYKHYLSGILRCGTCGATLVYEKPKKALQCCKYKHCKCNVSHSITVSKVNKIIKDELSTIINSNDLLSYTANITCTSTDTEELNILKNKLETQNKRLSRLKSAYLDGIFDLTEFKKEKEQIDKSITDINKEISLKANRKLDVNVFKKRVTDAYNLFQSETATELEKNAALKSVIEKIVYNKEAKELVFYYYF